ncbi:hypothetical protein BHE74_00054911 [Ensete ventricosum]|nr:hypothetical protein BHE74_00054911 [Ensete ventricosum]
MAGFEGVVVSDPWLQNQFTQVELRSLKSQFLANGGGRGSLTLRDLSATMSRLKIAGDCLTEDERAAFLTESYPDLDHHVDFELFLRVCFYSVDLFHSSSFSAF